MILSDFLFCDRSISWDYAKQTGVKHVVIRLPEGGKFDYTDMTHWQEIIDRFRREDFTPLVIEPIPNCIHEHIKKGDEKRDECIETFLKMLPIMSHFGIKTVCMNFMAHIGWLRTSSDIPERGGALVTGFDLKDFRQKDDFVITEDTLWKNLEYFLKAAVPVAEQYDVRLALHPDDPPLSKLGGVSRILTSYENINKAVNLIKSDHVGVTMCQATYAAMEEDLYSVIPKFAGQNKIFFVHFRNIIGDKYKFRETFHDNGSIDMAKILKLYRDCGVDVPIRIDHVPTMAGEDNNLPGYTAVGRLFAIGYLKGLIDAISIDGDIEKGGN